MNVFDKIMAELERAKAKHDWEKLTCIEMVAVMVQEAGEALREACKGKGSIKTSKGENIDRISDNLHTELIQTAAMCLRCLEDLEFEELPKDDPKYYALREVLNLAYLQAAEGKGAERHGNGCSWDEQPIFEIAAKVGLGYPLGQAAKKSQEARGMANRGDVQAAQREILGAINYLASVHVALGKQTSEENAEALFKKLYERTKDDFVTSIDYAIKGGGYSAIFTNGDGLKFKYIKTKDFYKDCEPAGEHPEPESIFSAKVGDIVYHKYRKDIKNIPCKIEQVEDGYLSVRYSYKKGGLGFNCADFLSSFERTPPEFISGGPQNPVKSFDEAATISFSMPKNAEAFNFTTGKYEPVEVTTFEVGDTVMIREDASEGFRGPRDDVGTIRKITEWDGTVNWVDKTPIVTNILVLFTSGVSFNYPPSALKLLRKADKGTTIWIAPDENTMKINGEELEAVDAVRCDECDLLCTGCYGGCMPQYRKDGRNVNWKRKCAT